MNNKLRPQPPQQHSKNHQIVLYATGTGSSGVGIIAWHMGKDKSHVFSGIGGTTISSEGLRGDRCPTSQACCLGRSISLHDTLCNRWHKVEASGSKSPLSPQGSKRGGDGAHSSQYRLALRGANAARTGLLQAADHFVHIHW